MASRFIPTKAVRIDYCGKQWFGSYHVNDEPKLCLRSAYGSKEKLRRGRPYDKVAAELLQDVVKEYLQR